MTESGKEWNASVYHRISRPQQQWGERVLARFPLQGNETVLDAGCGTGRLTERLLERLPDGRVIAVDLSQNMLDSAREYLARFADRVEYLQSDLAELPLTAAVDAIFSTAAFHWVTDHPRLFASLFRALRPGGVLMAQCGGAGNLDRLLARGHALATSPPFATYFPEPISAWEFADPPATLARLDAAGFVDAEAGLELAPTDLQDADRYREFLGNVIFRLHLQQLPTEALRSQFLTTLADQAAQDSPPFTLDYVRLNLSARKPARSA